MDRVQILLVEITKAYKLAHRDVPKLDELRAEASMVSADSDCIPTAYISRCYAHARVYGRSSVPTSKDLVSAWDNHIRSETVKESNVCAIEYKPRHACKMCAVVSLRLGLQIPDATDEEIWLSRQPVTEDELFCVRATIARDPVIWRHWQESPKSPYGGML